MDRELLEEITACLRQDRTVFHYFKDRYALMLLAHAVGDGCDVAALKRSPFGRLLGKPLVKGLLARIGRGTLRGDDVEAVWPARPLAYRLSLGHWPLDDDRWSRSWHQTTRRGHNLVVQLNFAASHNRHARRILGDRIEDPQWHCHPVAGGQEVTLGWVRLDVDLESGEALIEEIQSDWMREVPRAARDDDPDTGPLWIRYTEEVLRPHMRLWDEALLAAALWVLREEIGIRRIFMHTFDSGSSLKAMKGSPPPRSLYTSLPKRFCFQRTHCCPAFLKRERERRLRRALIDPTTQWHVLHL